MSCIAVFSQKGFLEMPLDNKARLVNKKRSDLPDDITAGLPESV
jgi:hypothetical protein